MRETPDPWRKLTLRQWLNGDAELIGMFIAAALLLGAMLLLVSDTGQVSTAMNVPQPPVQTVTR